MPRGAAFKLPCGPANCTGLTMNLALFTSPVISSKTVLFRGCISYRFYDRLLRGSCNVSGLLEYRQKQ